MGLVAAAEGGMYRLYRPLVHRRIHTSNYSSPNLTLSSRINNYEQHIYGRKLQLHHLETVYYKFGDLLSNKDKKNLFRRIEDTRKTIIYLENNNVWGLTRLCFSKNPMNNIKLNIGNVIIALFAKYKSNCFFSEI